MAVAKAQALQGDFTGASELIKNLAASNAFQDNPYPGDEGAGQPNAPQQMGGSPQQMGAAPKRNIMDVMAGGMAPNARRPMNQGQAQLGGMQAGGLETRGIGGPEVSETAIVGPKKGPPTAKEKRDLRSFYHKRYPGNPELADNLYQGDIANQNQEYQNELQRTGIEQGAQSKQQELQDKIQTEVDTQMGSVYKDNPVVRPWMSNMARELAQKEKGTPTQRWNAVNKKYIEPTINALDGFKKSIDSKEFFLKTFDDPQKQKALLGLNSRINSTLNKVPEAYRDQAVQSIRTELQNTRGIGPVSAEFATNPPSQSFTNSLKGLSKLNAASRFVMGHEFPADEKKLDMARDRLAKILKDNPGQPLGVAKNAVTNGLGIPDKVFDEALSMALKDGLVVPARDDDILKNIGKRYTQEDASTFDVFGSPLLGPMETHL